jgi:ABC-type multidrug transport system ATPase subunit
MTIRENVQVAALYGKKRSRREADRETERILKWIGLYDWRDESVSEGPFGSPEKVRIGSRLGDGGRGFCCSMKSWPGSTRRRLKRC